MWEIVTTVYRTAPDVVFWVVVGVFIFWWWDYANGRHLP